MSTVFLSCVAFILIFTKTYSFFTKNKRVRECLEKMPQPPAYPIIGHMLYFLNSSENMFIINRQISRDYYPIYKLTVLHEYAVNLVNPEDIELILCNVKHISKSAFYKFLHNWLGTGLLTSTGEKWQTRRKILTPAFHFNILQDFLNVFNAETKTLVRELKSMCSDGPIDVIPPITKFTLLTIKETAMGLTGFDKRISEEKQERYRDGINRMGQFLTYRVARPWIYNDLVYGVTSNGREEKTVLTTLHDFSATVIQAKQRQLNQTTTSSNSTKKRLAMLDLLLTYQANGADIDEAGIIEEVDTFMFEGHDTTSTALSNILMLLANHKKIQDEVFEEIVAILGNKKESPSYAELQQLKFMERCIKESLRLYPVIPFISRIVGEDVKTHTGYVIPEKCIVNIQIYDMHHNANVYLDPEKFDPDRFLPENIQKRHPFAYIPFSAGPRNCIGQKFAILEMKAALCGILMNFKLDPVDRPQDIVHFSDMVLRSKDPIRVNFVIRK